MNFVNRFTGQPFRPRFSVPEIFGEALSYEDQILWLATHFKQLKEYVESFNFATLKQSILEAVARQNKATLDAYMVDVDRRLTAMEGKVDHYVEGDLIWDPTQGTYVPSKEAMRRVYAALVQTGDSHVHDMAQLTVDEMAGKGTHAYSVTGLAEVGWSDEI